MVTIHEEAREETYKQILHVKEELHSWKEAPVFLLLITLCICSGHGCGLFQVKLTKDSPIVASIRYHVGGDDITEGYSKMGEITWEKHLLLRWTGNDGSPERSILPDLISHHWNLLSVLRL